MKTQVRVFFAVFMTVALFGTLGACNKANSGDDLEAIIGNDTQSQEADLHGIPSVQELPPVVPEARGRLSVTGVTGPRNPQLAWGVSLPFSQANIHQIGVDGTVYLAGWNALGAVRDGKLLWAYRTNHSATPTLADDGRIWFRAYEGKGYFCLNRAGQGGLLLASFKLPPDAEEAPGSGCNDRVLVSAGRAVATLDYECTRSVTGSEGTTYVGTDAPDIRAFTQGWRPAWKLGVPCSIEAMMAGPGKRLLFSCRDRSFHYIQNGVLGWTRTGDGVIEGGYTGPSSTVVSVMDRAGTTYFMDRRAKGVHDDDEEEGKNSTHIHALNTAGKIMWTLKTSNFSASSMRFDAKGHIYLTGRRGMHEWLICISD